MTSQDPMDEQPYSYRATFKRKVPPKVIHTTEVPARPATEPRPGKEDSAKRLVDSLIADILGRE